MLFLDLDGFKEVNDRLGHEAGDRLLVDVAARLRPRSARPTPAARFGGDEFLVLCEDLHEDDQVEQVAERLRRILAEPYVVADGVVRVTAAVGTAATDDPSARPEALIRAADEAMLRAKAGAGRPSRTRR